MKNFFYYQSLPDSMPVEDVANEFHELLIEKPFSGKSKFDFLQALLELSDRQWHTYEQLCESLKTQIEKTLINEWDGFDFDFAQGRSSLRHTLDWRDCLTLYQARMSVSFRQKWLSRSKRQLLSWVVISLIRIVV